MRKMEVSNLIYGRKKISLSIKESLIGKDAPSKHPLRRFRVNYPLKDVDGIRINDILRCDGLPFMTKPKSIVLYTVPSDKRKVDYWYLSYKPFQLKSGYWVLRLTSKGDKK